MRQDLNMSPGKLSAQVGHCAEIYWLNIIHKLIENARNGENKDVKVFVSEDIINNYINDKITKTVCRAKNLYQLLKAKDKAIELGLVEGEDFGLINDACLTELTPENPDGTCTTGIWFKPLPDEIAHEISKKYQLYS
jgi:peptidyl-tRNA hydrolase